MCVLYVYVCIGVNKIMSTQKRQLFYAFGIETIELNQLRSIPFFLHYIHMCFFDTIVDFIFVVVK